MEILGVGQKFAATANLGEGVYFTANGSGYMLIFNFDHPTAKEIAAVKSNQPFEIRCATISDILYITAKAGTLSWVDTPYAPWLNPSISDLMVPEGDTEGTALTVVMVDASTNVVKSIRLIGLGHDFSCKFLNELKSAQAPAGDFNTQYRTYLAEVNRVQAAYTSRDLAQLASLKYKVK